MKLNLTSKLIAASILIGAIHANAIDYSIANWNRLDRANGILECAPEVKQGNIAATDKALKDLAENELNDSGKFKQIISDAVSLSVDARMSAYLKLVGVADDKELVEFIGAREINQKYINSLSTNADLSEAQSRLVIERLSASLLGKIK